MRWFLFFSHDFLRVEYCLINNPKRVEIDVKVHPVELDCQDLRARTSIHARQADKCWPNGRDKHWHALIVWVAVAMGYVYDELLNFAASREEINTSSHTPISSEKRH